MKLHYIIHSMLAQKGANAIKIISVAIGLLASTLVFCRLTYNYSFDSCFRDTDRLYQLFMSYDINGSHMGPFDSCVGKLGECAYEAIGEDAEGVTTLDRLYLPGILKDGRRMDIEVLAVDSLFFKTMGIDLIKGNPEVDMTLPGVVYLSQTAAQNLFGSSEAVGRSVNLEDGTTLMVKGIFKDLPKNITMRRIDAAYSMPTTRDWGHYQLMRWGGSDSWPVYLRLKKGSTLTREEAREKIDRLYHTHIENREDNSSYIHVEPIRDTYLGNPSIKRMNLIMWILGSALLVITTLNYVLIIISSLSQRAKGIGIHKCCGADGRTITGMFFMETLIILLCAIALMAVILTLFSPIISKTLGLSLAEIFAPRHLFAPLGVMLFFLATGTFLPARLFAKIPVSHVFRRFTVRNRGWKRNILFIQIACVTFIGSLLAVVNAQYAEISGHDMGFRTERMVQLRMYSFDDPSAMVADIKSKPYIERIGFGESNPLLGFSGENMVDNQGRSLFNFRVSWIAPDYIDALGINLIEGREPRDGDEAVVTEEFARLMKWKRPVAGRIFNYYDKPVKVTGFARDIQINGFANDIKPVVLMGNEPENPYSSLGFVKLKEPFDENFRNLQKYFAENYPTADISPWRFDEITGEIYSDVVMFRNSALIATIALIFISLMGLVGFTRDELQRRSKEIAIRKVNGAAPGDILGLLTSDVLKTSLPAIAAGLLAGIYVGHIWVSNFSVRTQGLWLWHAVAAICVLILVIGCTVAIIRRTANENPVNRLKSE